MLTKIALAFVLTLFIFIGCKKDINSNDMAASNVQSNAAVHGAKDTTGRWFGTYQVYNGDPDELPDTISENVLIENGRASVPYNKENETTSIGYYLPSDQNLHGDNIAFETAINNDSNVVELDVMGAQNIASVKYVKGINNTGTITMAIGNTIQSVQIAAIDFSTFKTLVIALKNGHAFFYVSNKLILSFTYTDSDNIGTIKTLSIGNNYHQPKWFLPANGNTVCDYIKLYNSNSRSLLMKEDFNINGKSNTIFY